MAPSFTETSTTTYPYANDSTLISWIDTADAEHTYTISYTYTQGSVNDSTHFRKLLERMRNEMCKSGWIEHIDHYLSPKVVPVCLRSVRLDGRGWGNKK